MAMYNYDEFLTRSQDRAFDGESAPGTAAPYSGIYRCSGCGREVASNSPQPLPPQNHHQHSPYQGAIRWRLIVYADGEAK